MNINMGYFNGYNEAMNIKMYPLSFLHFTNAVILMITTAK